MNRKQWMLLTTTMLIGLFSCLPAATGMIMAPIDIDADDYLDIWYLCFGNKNLKIEFTLNGTVDVFVTNDTDDITSYMATGNIPAGVIGNMTASSGTFCVTIPDPEGDVIVVFGNEGGASPVGGEFGMAPRSCGIPGFGVLFVFFALLATFGILWSKKKFNF